MPEQTLLQAVVAAADGFLAFLTAIMVLVYQMRENRVMYGDVLKAYQQMNTTYDKTLSEQRALIERLCIDITPSTLDRH